MKKILLIISIIAATIATSHAARRPMGSSPVAPMDRLDELCSLTAMLSFTPPGDDAREKLSASCYQDICDVTTIKRDPTVKKNNSLH